MVDLSVMIPGSFFGGKSRAVLWWEAVWYAAHNDFISKRYFVGKDQNIMNSLALKYADKVFSVRNAEDCHDDPWFYYQYYLASAKDRHYQNHIYNAGNCSLINGFFISDTFS